MNKLTVTVIHVCVCLIISFIFYISLFAFSFLILAELRSADVVDKEYPDKRTMEITDLSPGSSYSFRVSAVNRFGTGLPSQPSRKDDQKKNI